MSFLSLRALAVVGLSLMISACAGASGPAHGPGEVGKAAPALSIQSVNGKGAVSLSSVTGKVVVVGFFATWSDPCKKSLAQLEELAKQNPGKVEVIGIAVDDTSRGIADFAKAQGVTFPVAWDENHTLMWRWSVEKMPSTFILDSKGNVRFTHDTAKDEADLIAREVAQLTNDGSVSNAKTEVASAPVTAPSSTGTSSSTLAVAVVEPPAPAAEPEKEVAPPSKPAKPAAKKNAPKKAPKKSAAK